MINVFKKYKPLKYLHIPANWLVIKNNMYDISPEILKCINSDEEEFLIKDTFFQNDIFISRINYPLSTSSEMIGIVSIHARLLNHEDYHDKYSCFYDVELSIFTGKRKNIYTKENSVTNRFDAAHMASEYMVIFSQYIAPDFEFGKLDKNSNFDELIDLVYKKRNHDARV
ncbi:hypothetical protein [Xenorhabdus sp. KK7.4]|uniref:hypothetical protein n=1 Tax=Xenorhabdus sp. KK7.4 TaxID=1851572 RepID=UPI000C039FD7|nr:hypothetical protein [Xenorhabdus sp. KK7.4]PHM52859.1 hypothetical protein Xekk_02977 [Xenorhabdus sp. KK7.4]